MDTWSIRKTKPIQSQLKPIKANSNPIKANKMPKQTQFKPKQTQFQGQYMLLRLTMNNRLGIEESQISLLICPLFLLYSGIQMCIFDFSNFIANNEKHNIRSRK
jgi:hypothetical protein